MLRLLFKSIRAVAVSALAAVGVFLSAPATRAIPVETDIRRDAVVDAVAEVIPCVVNVATESVVESHDLYEDFFRQFYHYPPRQQVESSLGSGVIISPDGYLLTNLHVVNRATRIQVKLSDEAGGGVYDVERVYVGSPQTDVAVLKIVPHKKGEKFRAVRFGRDDDLLLGETVLALGNPFGLGVSVSRGILSSKRRAVPKENTDLSMENWLQTDALINPGNSGGALINLRGELIGVNVAVLQGAQGIGFAIPIKEVRLALGEIFLPETASRWFGARVRGNAPPVIDSIDTNSPADKAGLRPNDEILEVDGHEPGDFVDFNRLLRDSAKMDFTLTVKRGDSRLKMPLRLMPFTQLLEHRLGLSLRELTPALVDQLGLARFGGLDAGLLVAGIEIGGPGDHAGLSTYCLLDGIEGKRVNNFYQAFLALSGMKAGETAHLSVLVPQTSGDEIYGYRQHLTRLKVR